jgi:hypothetical protein
MKPFFITNLMEILSVYVIKRDFVIMRDLYGEMKIFPAKLRYNQRFAIAGFVIAREYCISSIAGLEKYRCG